MVASAEVVAVPDEVAIDTDGALLVDGGTLKADAVFVAC